LRFKYGLLFALLLTALAAGLSLTPPAARSDETTSESASLEVAASPSAEELPGKRTATSDTFRLHSGLRETRIYGTPVNYEEPDGKWLPIEEGLEEGESGEIVNGANSLDIELPPDLQGGPTRMESGSQWVSSRILGTDSEAAELEDGAAVYESPEADASFEYTTLPDGLKEDIELAGPNSPAAFRYSLRASVGLSPRLLDDGSVVFQDTDGQTVFLLPAPTIADAGSTHPDSTHVAYSLAPAENGAWTLAVEVDESWLADPDRRWPLSIDPTVQLKSGGTSDCQYWLREPGRLTNETGNRPPECGRYGTGTLRASVSNGGSEIYRSALKFSLGSIPKNSSIVSAGVNLYDPSEANSVGRVQLRRITRNWEETLNWFYAIQNLNPNNQWKIPGGDFAEEGSELSTGERGTAAGWWTFTKGLPVLVSEWVEGTKPNYGLIVKLASESSCGSGCTFKFDSSSGTNSEALRPYMSVVYRPPAPSSSQVVSPTEGTRTARRLKLKAHWTSPGVTGVTFLYREGRTGAFQNIPPELVHKPNGEALAKWPYAVSGVEETESLYFDAAHASSKLRKEGGPIQVRAWFDALAPSSEGLTSPVEVAVSRFTGGAHDGTAQVGPGSLNLMTGNLALGRTDVSVPGFVSRLEFSRSFNTRGLGAEGSKQASEENKSALGAGWKAGVPVEEAGGSDWRNLRLVEYTETIGGEEGEPAETYSVAYALLTDLEGGELAFEKRSDGTYAPPPEVSGWSLTAEGANRFVLADPSGNRTTFDNLGGGSEYVPTAISQVGSTGPSTRIEYELPEGRKRIHMVVAPTPAGVGCITQAEATSNVGCHALIFTYAPATTWGAPSADGERLSKITYYAPGTGGPWDMASYKYDVNGRLIEEWDPRISPALAEKYTYNSAGQLATITPPGQKSWELEYASFDEEAGGGRLVAAKRDSLVAGTAQTTVAYGVPLSGSGAPYDLGLNAITQWGQKDLPTDATAVFPPNEVPSSLPVTYTSATIYYLDAEGYSVNTARPQGAGMSGPSIDTNEADSYGNPVRELTPANRLRVLAKPEGERKQTWEALETKRHFNEAGTQMVEEWGPVHQVRLESGSVAQARLHKIVEYDAGWTGLAPKPHLPTREVTGASIAGEGIDADQRTVETKYEWKLRKPIETIVDPGEGNLAIKQVTAYDEATGLPVEVRQPSNSGGGGAGTTKTVYYSAGGSTFAECGEHAQYAGLPCKTTPAAQASGTGRPQLLVKTVKSYNNLDEPTEIVESPAGGTANVRQTNIAYDAAGRQLRKIITGGGTAIPKVETEYSSTLGLPIAERFKCESECGNPQFLTSFGYSSQSHTGLKSPSDVAVDSSGNVWAVDKGNNRIVEYNEAGEYLREAGSLGSGGGQLSSPSAIALDTWGNLDVADTGNNRVVRFDPEGKFKAVIGADVNKTKVDAGGTQAERNYCTASSGNVCQAGSTGSGEGLMAEPVGIASSAGGGGSVYVVERANNRVEKFGLQGELLAKFGTAGAGAGQFSQPSSIAIGPKHLWVADTGNNRIEKWSFSWTYEGQFGIEGSGNGQLKAPAAVESDATGNVWVADQGNSRVQKFSEAGEYLAKFGTSGNSEGQFTFSAPPGLAFDGKGNVLVADSGNNRVQKWSTSGFDSQETKTSYDALGRPVTYEDADGNKAETTYDLEGRPIKTTDNKGSQTIRYDPTSGLPVELEDSAAGVFTASYDADGNLVKRGLPDGLIAETTYNEADEPMSLAYTKGSFCGASCIWLQFGLERSISGQIVTETGTLGTDHYRYDKAGRLTNADETPQGGQCTTRAYTYNADSNRLSKMTRSPGIGGVCSESGGATQTYKYDGADRLEGPTYDSWGRITSLPGEFAGGKTLTTSYFANDMVATQAQNGITNSFTLDASLRQRSRLQAGGLEGTEILHFDAPGDSTAWTERGSTWTRSIFGLGGEVAALQEPGKEILLQLTNLHGDVSAVAGVSPEVPSLKNTFTYDEFGNPMSGTSGRYAWIGGKQRRTELQSGIIQMGVRSYVPALGRFLSLDPVAGGSANVYDYANQDPLNQFDLTGCAPGEATHKCVVNCLKSHCGGHNYAKVQHCLAQFHSTRDLLTCFGKFCDVLPAIRCIGSCPKTPKPPKPPGAKPPKPAPEAPVVPVPAPIPEPIPILVP